MKKGAGWPIGIALLLATNVAVGLTVMRIAANDPSFSVEPDYYRKAVEYDSTLAQARVNAELGWAARAAITRDNSDGLQLVVSLADRDGNAITNASVSAVAMFIARAAEADSIALAPDGTGNYGARLAAGYTGRWEIRVAAIIDGLRFTSTVRTESPATVRATPVSHE